MPCKGRIGQVSRTEKGCVGVVEWKISDFSSLTKEDGAWCKSPDFSLGGHEWFFSIFPNGVSSWNSYGFIQLVLLKVASSPHTDTLHFSVSLRHVNGHKECEMMGQRGFVKERQWYKFPPSLSRAELLRRRREFLPGGVLTLVLTLNRGSSATSASNSSRAECCLCKEHYDSESIASHQKSCVQRTIQCPRCFDEVLLRQWLDGHECQKGSTEGCHCTPPHLVSVHVDKMVQDFKELFLKHEDGDATINVQGRKFPVHKTILSARSPVLASAFRHDMKEKAANAIDIEDCDLSSFSDFLSFLYYGNVDTITTENVFSLFTTADKYDVQDLRSHCLAFMKENLSVDTFVDTVTVALQHVEKDLIALVTDFFAKNQLDIIMTVKWQSFLVANPIQSNEIMIKALKTIKK